MRVLRYQFDAICRDLDWMAVSTNCQDTTALEEPTTYCLPKLLELCSGSELISEVSSHEETYKVPHY